jgi:hypothetical protein
MGAFDETDARSPTRSMLGRGIGEARRRIVLLIFLAFFLLLTIVALRRQDTIKDVVNHSLHRTSNAPAVEKPEIAVDSKADTKSHLKSGKTSMWGKSNSKGPYLDDRTLAPSSLADIHNSTLGVWCFCNIGHWAA